jgi:hypothetical protein
LNRTMMHGLANVKVTHFFTGGFKENK